jgi:hypothetical protein
MRKQTLLVVVPLVVVVLVAGVAFAAPGGEHADDAKLDKLHVVRPIAASPEMHSLQGFEERAALQTAVGGYVTGVLSQGFLGYLDWFGVVLTSLAPPPPVTVTRTSVASNSYNGDFLSCVRWRESHGDYTVHNTQGSGASGAYQFMPGTWNSIAASEGRTDLVGLDPAAASPADQDAMAAALYAQRGAAPWGGGC